MEYTDLGIHHQVLTPRQENGRISFRELARSLYPTEGKIGYWYHTLVQDGLAKLFGTGHSVFFRTKVGARSQIMTLLCAPGVFAKALSVLNIERLVAFSIGSANTIYGANQFKSATNPEILTYRLLQDEEIRANVTATDWITQCERGRRRDVLGC
jgi:hypothetical protein